MSSMAKYFSFYANKRKQSGFTLIELMVGIAIVAILVTVGLPSLNQFTLQMRVDNEISAMHRLLLTARNTAINTEMNAVVCPLDGGSTCDADWTGTISVFSDANGDNQFNTADGDRLITTKDAAKDNDSLTSSLTRYTYSPTGQLANNAAGSIGYCPYGKADFNRGVEISASGRVYATSDINKDGKDQTRDGSSVSC